LVRILGSMLNEFFEFEFPLSMDVKNKSKNKKILYASLEYLLSIHNSNTTLLGPKVRQMHRKPS